MKLISWNVNGLRACANKGFFDFLSAVDADIFCIQETKMQKEQSEFDFKNFGYCYEFWNCAEKKGYSGTLTLCKKEPISIKYGIGIKEHDNEGRVVAVEFSDFYLVNVYTPNAQRELTRLPYRMQWEVAFLNFLKELEKSGKGVLVCGDLNVAHKEIDVKNARANRGCAGFTDEEREKFQSLLDSGFIDTFRHFYPTLTDAFSWWSYMGRAREKNIGWRIDYFLASKSLQNSLKGAKIHSEIYGSDHCPVELLAELK